MKVGCFCLEGAPQRKKKLAFHFQISFEKMTDAFDVEAYLEEQVTKSKEK
jgi:hypothetical protein